MTPEQEARIEIDALLEACGWIVQDYEALNLSAGSGQSGVDALGEHPGQHFSMVLTNPPFGKKSSIAIVNEEGAREKDDTSYERTDFWTTTKNKQLNFVQHCRSILTARGRCAMVVPDNVLFEGGAGETVRRRLLASCDVHTLLRLPTGIWYSPGVKANVVAGGGAMATTSC